MSRNDCGDCNPSTVSPAHRGTSALKSEPDEQRFEALDGVRGIAILLVLVGHTSALPTAGQGVQLFFVLSGFLITRILLLGGEEIARGRSTAQIFVRFYI